ncbi:MAG: hypothetical protein HQM06_15225 [Magnetococcales bacterium]|nr:hypothetical protein [Magnetococcales bacterium]
MGSAFGLVAALLSTLWTWALLAVSSWVGYQVAQVRSLEGLPGFELLPSFLSIPLQHQADNSILFALAGVISGFVVFFLAGYVLQAGVDFVRLSVVRASLLRAEKQGWLSRLLPEGSSRKSPAQWYWISYPLFSRLWREYAETLHVQQLPTPEDEPQRVCYRATLTAETVFSTQALVNVPMRVEFFRHLPGILTGAGIVSTFAGILLGLSEFNPAVDAQQITLQLKNLFSGITTAFIASFFAISTAILVTILEKFLLHWRYAQVVALQQDMDDLFRAGVEPEYLARLVEQGPHSLDKLQQDVERLAHHFSPDAMRGGDASATLTPLQALQGDADTAQTLKTVMSHFLLEFSQLLQRTADSYGRRREEGRAFEIQLISVGERLDVAMGEFADLVIRAKEEMSSHHAATLAVLTQQLALLTRQVEQQQQPVLPQAEPAAEFSLQALQQQTQLLQTLTTSTQQWQQEMSGVVQGVLARLPQTETLQQAWQNGQQQQTEAWQTLRQQMQEMTQRLPDKGEVADWLQRWQQGQQLLLQPLQGMIGQVLQQLQQLEQQLQGQQLRLEEQVMPQLQQQMQHQQQRMQQWLQERDEQQAAGQRQSEQWLQERAEQQAEGQRQSEQWLQQWLAQWQQAQTQQGEVLRHQLQHWQTSWSEQWQQQRGDQAVFADRLLDRLHSELTGQWQEQQSSQNQWTDRLLDRLQGGLLEQLQQQQSQQSVFADRLVEQLKTELAGQWQAQQGSQVGMVEQLLAQVQTTLSGQWQAQQNGQAQLAERLVAELQSRMTVQRQADEQSSQGTQELLRSWQQEWQRLWQEQQQNHVALSERLLGQLQAEMAAQFAVQPEALPAAAPAAEQDGQPAQALVAEESLHQLRNQLLEVMKSQQTAQASWAEQLAGQLQSLLQQQSATTREQVQGFAEQLQGQVQQALQEGARSEQTQILAERVVEQLSGRLEQSLGSLSHGLVELREKLASERSTIVSTVADWRADSSRSEREQSQQMDQKLGEVIAHVNTHHHHLTRIIGELNQNLSQDLDGMREGLLTRNEASTQQMLQRVSDLGRGLEEVISTVGQEQTVFIEMLGERLEALRRRLRTK